VTWPVAWYREFVPCAALQSEVYAFFSFVPGPLVGRHGRPLVREISFRDATFCSPQFADGHVSLVFELGRTCQADGRWDTSSSGVRGTILGPMSRVGRTEGSDRPLMVGAYFRSGQIAALLRSPMSDLTDSAVDVEDVWGSSSARIAGELLELEETARIDHLESVLLARLRTASPRSGSIDLPQLTRHILQRQGRVPVEGLARAAGVSRQHLTRQFREHVGIGPKLYCRLARFHSALVYAGCRGQVDWAEAALDMGYADQSHMIAEFRQFAGLTPQALANRDWFHPFIERAKAARSAR
jgi:AraC-like DNA-binding protein